MRSVKRETVFPMTPEQLFELHARPEALRRLSPSFPPVRSVEQDGGFEAGSTVRISIGVGPLALSWVAELEEVDFGRRFVDVQTRGPFESWRHVHSFSPAPGGCAMRDEVTWVSRRGLGFLDGPLIGPMLRSYFKKRHGALMQWVMEETKTNRVTPGQTRSQV
jgi:ligand-binding SRPBCC domain-containing protein